MPPGAGFHRTAFPAASACNLHAGQKKGIVRGGDDEDHAERIAPGLGRYPASQKGRVYVLSR